MLIELNQVTTIFLAIAVFMIGSYLNSKIKILEKYCIPAPVVGGLLVALVLTSLRATGLA